LNTESSIKVLNKSYVKTYVPMWFKKNSAGAVSKTGDYKIQRIGSAIFRSKI